MGRLEEATSLEDPTNIKEEIAQCLENLYSSENWVTPNLDGIEFPLIQEGAKDLVGKGI